MKKIVTILSILLISSMAVNAQFYVGPFVGFKSSGLKGTLKLSSGGNISTGSVADGGSTGFNAGLCVGYQILPGGALGGWYKLEINIDGSYSSFAYLENGYNSSQGAGKFSAIGFSGGKTTVISIDVMPIHRLNIPSFSLLSPFLGLGLGLNIMSTADVTVGPPSQNGTVSGKSDFQLGLLVFYGTLIRVTSHIQPFIQFKHLVPFGSETEFTEAYQSAAGGGSQNYVLSVQDVPGYFNLVGGVRFTF